jgi:Tfp pilus assembly protein PilN
MANHEALGDVLARLWKEAGIKTRDVVLGLSGKRAIARLVPLPRIPANQLHQVILSEAEQYTLFRDEEPLVDYFTVDTDTESSTVFYAAASQRLVNAYKNALKHAKLRLMAVDIAQYAALRALVHFKLSDSEVWDGVIVLPGRLVITSWFGQKLLNWREVSSQRWEEEGEDQRYQFIETEVSRTLRMEPGKEREILLAKGTLAESGEMADYFRYNTDLPLQAAGIDYWARRVPPEQLANITPAALGLGLWALDEHIPTLDVLNRATSKVDPFAELRERIPGFTFDRSVAIAGGVSLVTLLMGVGGTYYVATSVIGKKITELKNANTALTSAIGSKTAEKEQLSRREASNRQILELIGEGARTNPSVTFLTQINDIVPPDAWLTSVDATTPEVFELKGAASTQQSGLTLARAISEFREVDTVKVLDLKRTAPDRYEFTIDVTLSKTAQPAGPEPTAAGTPPPAGAPPAGPSASEKGQAVMQRFNSTNPEGQKK